MTCAFSKKKMHSLSVAPEPLAIWNKELEGLDSELSFFSGEVLVVYEISEFFL